MPVPRPSPVRTDGSNTFARHSIEIRATGLIDETVQRNPDYPQSTLDDLSRLAENIRSNSALTPIRSDNPDGGLWLDRFARHEGETWLDTDWFFAEMLAYRHAVEITRFREAGRDLFAPFKQEELESSGIRDLLKKSQYVTGTLEERLLTYLQGSLWGNRIDLSITASTKRGTEAESSHLLTDHFDSAVNHLMSTSPNEVHVIADNAGTELGMDLALCDFLLLSQITKKVVVHIKAFPVLISDVIAQDVDNLLAPMLRWSGETERLAVRLKSFRKRGELVFKPHFFWNTDGGYFELPDDLYSHFSSAALVISKGDANYRRASNDAIWPAGTSLADALPEFPAPLLLLRTLKCDTLLEVEQKVHDRLDQEEPDWKETGKYGVAQFAKMRLSRRIQSRSRTHSGRDSGEDGMMRECDDAIMRE